MTVSLKTLSSLVAVGAVAFMAGLYVGYSWLLTPKLWVGAVNQSAMLTEHALLQYREGSYLEAQQALGSYLNYLAKARPVGESWHPGESPWLDSRGIKSEQTLAWSRLAVLHERNGNQASAASAWTQAEALARTGKWRDPSRNNLRKVILKQDQAYSRR